MIKDQAEKLREIIKKNTDDMREGLKAKIITVTSGKGGVGKSNVAVNLGLELMSKNKRVLIIDADLGLANVEILMGKIPKYNLLEVINGEKVITDIISEGPNGIKFISGGSGIGELANVSEDKLKFFAQNLGVLDEMFDIIIIDTGAGISESVMTFARIADQVLLVTTSDPTAITDAYALLKVLKKEASNNSPNIKVIVNMVKNKEDAKLVFNKLNMVCEKFLNESLEVIEYLPEDVMLEKAVRMQKPFVIEFPKSNISVGVKELCNKVMDIIEEEKDKIEIEDVKVEAPRRGLMSLLNNFIKKENV